MVAHARDLVEKISDGIKRGGLGNQLKAGKAPFVKVFIVVTEERAIATSATIGDA